LTVRAPLSSIVSALADAQETPERFPVLLTQSVFTRASSLDGDQILDSRTPIAARAMLRNRQAGGVDDSSVRHDVLFKGATALSLERRCWQRDNQAQAYQTIPITAFTGTGSRWASEHLDQCDGSNTSRSSSCGDGRERCLCGGRSALNLRVQCYQHRDRQQLKNLVALTAHPQERTVQQVRAVDPDRGLLSRADEPYRHSRTGMVPATLRDIWRFRLQIDANGKRAFILSQLQTRSRMVIPTRIY